MSDSSSANGVIQLQSRYSVSETLDHLEGLLRERGVKVFARIDQKREAEAAGLTLRPTELLVFGNPKAGTPIMQLVPSVAIDLPLKVVAWQDDAGDTVISYNSAEFLLSRHGLTSEQVQKLDVSALVELARN
jgi:uncharacterized protein (DUF302 family)